MCLLLQEHPESVLQLTAVLLEQVAFTLQEQEMEDKVLEEQLNLSLHPQLREDLLAQVAFTLQEQSEPQVTVVLDRQDGEYEPHPLVLAKHVQELDPQDVAVLVLDTQVQELPTQSIIVLLAHTVSHTVSVDVVVLDWQTQVLLTQSATVLDWHAHELLESSIVLALQLQVLIAFASAFTAPRERDVPGAAFDGQ